MVEGGLRAPLVDSSSIYQIGGQAGHRVDGVLNEVSDSQVQG